MRAPLKNPKIRSELGRTVRTTDRLDRNGRTTKRTFFRRRRGRRSGLGRFLELVDLLDHDKNDERDDQKINDIVEEQAVIQSRRSGFLRLGQGRKRLSGHIQIKIAEIHFAEQKPDRRHDNITDHGGHDLSERAADDHTDRHIDHITAHDELFEFVHELH